MGTRKSDYRGAAFWLALWLVALIVYGLAGTSDLETSQSLTSEVNRQEVMAWAR